MVVMLIVVVDGGVQAAMAEQNLHALQNQVNDDIVVVVVVVVVVLMVMMLMVVCKRQWLNRICTHFKTRSHSRALG